MKNRSQTYPAPVPSVIINHIIPKTSLNECLKSSLIRFVLFVAVEVSEPADLAGSVPSVISDSCPLLGPNILSSLKLVLCERYVKLVIYKYL